MAGNLVPLVLIPRYSCYSAAESTEFMTIAMDVTPYTSAILNVWRSKLVGASATFTLTFEESTDQTSWSACATSPDPSSSPPADKTEIQYTASLKKRWFRAKIVLTGVATVVTCWIVGFLEERES